MSTLVVQYRCRPEQADDNHRLVAAVFRQIADAEPAGIRYATFRLEDGTFVHIAAVDGDNPLNDIDAFTTFQQDLLQRRDRGHGPNARQATLVGSYRFDLTEKDRS